MKHLSKLFLIMTILCLTGCSEDEEPQSVAFSIDEVKVGPGATRMSITVEANCPWTITDEKDRTFTEIRQGSGTVETPFIVFTNPDYETKQYTVTVTSKDGTSTDVLTVTQGEAFGLEAGKASPVAAEGGTIDIPVRTNDQIGNIETPEWIAFTSSRALTGYTYTFTAEPNKTGSPRTGYISLKGKNYTSSRIEVKQDSYAPTGVIIEGLPTKTVEKSLSFAVQLEPSYADWDKLNITSDNASNVWLNGQTASVELKEYGKSTINFYGDGKEIYSTQVERFPSKILPYSDDINVYWGEEFLLSYNYKSDDYVVKIENPEIIKPEEDGKLKASNVGASAITVRHEELGLEDKVTV